jgi:hypothetical protein
VPRPGSKRGDQEDRPPTAARRRLDIAGLSISVSAVFLLVLPLVLGHELGWPLWTFIAMARGEYSPHCSSESSARSPSVAVTHLLNLDVLSAPGLRAGLTTLLLMQIGYGGFLLTLALHLQAGRSAPASPTRLWRPRSGPSGSAGVACPNVFTRHSRPSVLWSVS